VETVEKTVTALEPETCNKMVQWKTSTPRPPSLRLPRLNQQDPQPPTRYPQI